MNEIGRWPRVRGNSPAMLARLRGVLLDIDGTITTAGRLGAAAYDAPGL